MKSIEQLEEDYLDACADAVWADVRRADTYKLLQARLKEEGK